jgi:hypothetical protein
MLPIVDLIIKTTSPYSTGLEEESALGGPRGPKAVAQVPPAAIICTQHG